MSTYALLYGSPYPRKVARRYDPTGSGKIAKSGRRRRVLRV
jgi:hypothetical protein